jgi:hypothetical protein
MRLDRRGFLRSATVAMATSAAKGSAAVPIEGRVPKTRTTQVQVTDGRAAAPLCAVLMPYRRRLIASGLVDFDVIYRRAIEPAVRDAGFNPMRAGEWAITEKHTFERLLLADYLIADVSDSDPDLSYQLGVRHASRASGTLVIRAELAPSPFYEAAAAVITYRVDERGEPADADDLLGQLRSHLRHARQNLRNDSPLFQLLDVDQASITRLNIDTFREHVTKSNDTKEKLRHSRGAAEIDAVRNELGNIDAIESGILIELLMSYRGVGAWERIIDLYNLMSSPLKRAPAVREQLAYALHLSGRSEEATREIDEVIRDAPTGSAYAVSGRINKDLWSKADLNRSDEARGLLRHSIEAYNNGFQLDWRDAYPGVNAVTMMEMEEKPDPRQVEILPVVQYAALQNARRGGDYWDYATLLELEVIARDDTAAKVRLAEAIARARQPQELQTTARNIKLIAGARQARGERTDWIGDIVAALLGDRKW